MNVLIAEDNPANQTLIDTVCRALEVDPVIVPDGAAAVAAMQAGHYDLILMDVHMPVMDGIAATTAIRAVGGRADRTLIFGLTADLSPETVNACKAAGMNEVLAKPLRPPRLSAVLSVVRSAIDGQESKTSAAPEPAPAHRASDPRVIAAAAGRLHYLNLDKIRERLGARWTELADRVATITTNVLDQHVGIDDIYEQIDLLDFVLIFGGLDQAAGEAKCHAIAQEITRRLFGEAGGELFEIQTIAADLRLAPDTPLTRDVVLEAVRRQAAALGTPEAAGPAVEPLKEPPHIELSALHLAFEPVWDSRRRGFPMRAARATLPTGEAFPAGRLAPTRPEADDREALASLDDAVLSLFARSLQGYERLEAPALLCLPVHYDTLAKPMRRWAYAQRLDQLPGEVRARLIVEIIDLPPGILAARLAEIQAPLRSRCLNASAIVGFGCRDFAAIKAANMLIVGVDLASYKTGETADGQRIVNLVRGAQREGLTLFLRGVETKAQLAVAAHFRYLSGPAIADPQTVLSPAVRCHI